MNNTSNDVAYENVCALVNDFEANITHYLSNAYQEAEVRKDFIDKFLIALGWDVNHEEQKNPYEQEVKVERTESDRKRPDYTFYLNPDFKNPIMFLEAKKPAKDLKNADYYFQTIRYGWNAGTPVAVLTDFEEFHILDCRYKPDINYVLNGAHKYIHYSEYANKETFFLIYYLISREAVEGHSLTKYADNLPKPKGKAVQRGLFKEGYKTLDEDFLFYLDEVRETLAKAFKKNDESLESDQLTEATQRTIDRLVFIRFLEDKMIEPEYYVDKFGDKVDAWKDFITVCRKLDAKYNGIVFKRHFIDDQDFKGPELREFEAICESICHLNSAYLFNFIPIYILGTIYERFLGKVIHSTAQRVKVEDKPGVRKAGGVYYTPKYIVDYIVKNTVGELIQGKSPTEISKITIADIACGSGSFLLGAFEYILEYLSRYYQDIPDKAKKDGCHYHSGKWVLSIKQKQQILQNNIYGVDIDNQAVEVTQLSLALKMLEDETTATANEMSVMFHERILPDLSKNIVPGNSLIGTDILEGGLFTDENERKEKELTIKPMDFEAAFPSIFKNGGFDCVIGNPPYVDIKGMNDDYVNYIFTNYKYANNRINMFEVFIERSLTISNNNIKYSMIVPAALISQDSYKQLRQYITNNYSINSLVRLPNESFGSTAGEVKVDTVIFVLSKYKQNNKTEIISYEGYGRINCINGHNAPINNNINQHIWSKSENCVWSINTKENDIDIINKCKLNSIKLEDCVSISLGITPYDKYKGHTENQIQNKVYHSDHKKDKTYKKLLAGNDVGRYYIKWNGEQWLSYGPWLGAPRESKYFTSKRILVKQIIDWTSKRIWASLTEDELYNTQNAFNLIENTSYKLEYILGILNSKLMTYYHKKVYLDEYKMRFQKILIKDCRQIPISMIEFGNNKDVEKHNTIVEMVKQIIIANNELFDAKTDKDKNYYENKVKGLDAKIDKLVYELYGLTEDEIKIVEENTK